MNSLRFPKISELIPLQRQHARCRGIGPRRKARRTDIHSYLAHCLPSRPTARRNASGRNSRRQMCRHKSRLSLSRLD